MVMVPGVNFGPGTILPATAIFIVSCPSVRLQSRVTSAIDA